MNNFMNFLLTFSWITLILSATSALVYETYALITRQVPVISHLAEVWIMQHKIPASILIAAIIGFIAWLIVHWAILPNDLLVQLKLQGRIPK
jgi:hypothetical protein